MGCAGASFLSWNVMCFVSAGLSPKPITPACWQHVVCHDPIWDNNISIGPVCRIHWFSGGNSTKVCGEGGYGYSWCLAHALHKFWHYLGSGQHLSTKPCAMAQHIKSSIIPNHLVTAIYNHSWISCAINQNGDQLLLDPIHAVVIEGNGILIIFLLLILTQLTITFVILVSPYRRTCGPMVLTTTAATDLACSHQTSYPRHYPFSPTASTSGWYLYNWY